MGVGAKNQLLTNLKKTVFGFKHMLGRKFKDPYVQEAIKGLPYNISEGTQGEVRARWRALRLTRRRGGLLRRPATQCGHRLRNGKWVA